jgi:hypothetical protein
MGLPGCAHAMLKQRRAMANNGKACMTPYRILAGGSGNIPPTPMKCAIVITRKRHDKPALTPCTGRQFQKNFT